MSKFTESEQLRSALREPFPKDQIGKLPRGNVQLSYVGHAAVTDRLNALDPEWNYKILERIEYTDGNGKRHLDAIIGEITIGGKSMVESGDVDRVGRYGEELKLAIGDFIRRGAMRYGVALDLWSKEDLLTRSEPEAPETKPPKAKEKPAPAEQPDAEKLEQAAPSASGANRHESYWKKVGDAHELSKATLLKRIHDDSKGAVRTLGSLDPTSPHGKRLLELVTANGAGSTASTEEKTEPPAEPSFVCDFVNDAGVKCSHTRPHGPTWHIFKDEEAEVSK